MHHHCFLHRGTQILTASSSGTPTFRSTSARTDAARSQLQVHSVPSNRGRHAVWFPALHIPQGLQYPTVLLEFPCPNLSLQGKGDGSHICTETHLCHLWQNLRSGNLQDER
jgi:hypothetical protein